MPLVIGWFLMEAYLEIIPDCGLDYEPPLRAFLAETWRSSRSPRAHRRARRLNTKPPPTVMPTGGCSSSPAFPSPNRATSDEPGLAYEMQHIPLGRSNAYGNVPSRRLEPMLFSGYPLPLLENRKSICNA